MLCFKQRHNSGITIHGSGKLGGKGNGLLKLAGISPKDAVRLPTDVLTTEIYERYIDAGRQFDTSTVAYLSAIHAKFNETPIAVRPSEKDENNPLVPTSGLNISFMLPNNSNPQVSLKQFLDAVRLIYEQFISRQGATSKEGMAIVINPIPGIFDDTYAGRFFYPMSSGVADSFSFYPIGDTKPHEGIARIAFGHGYGVVRDDFPVIPIVTIENPIQPSKISRGQKMFYAIIIDREVVLREDGMSTMARLNLEFAGHHAKYFGNGRIASFDNLLAKNDPLNLCYLKRLQGIMAEIKTKASGEFQIEFTFNIVDGKGIFHVVQYKQLRDLKSAKVIIPEDNKKVYLSTQQVQGHGIIPNLSHAIVISQFNYKKEQHDEVRASLRRLNNEMKAINERYIIVCPGRLGTRNKDWGVYVDFPDISNAAVIVEFGYDISGSSTIKVTDNEMTGGIYGSHFLYQILGGESEANKIKQLRMLGSQGTHFITNLITTGAFYVHIDPSNSRFDSWFFSPPEGHETAPIFLKKFDSPVTAYADFGEKRCLIK